MMHVLEQHWSWRRTPIGAGALFLGQGLALYAVYDLDVNIIPTLLAVLVFGVLALLRPDLALLYIPLSLPLAWRAKGIWDASFGISNVYFPLHEVVIAILAGVTLLHWLSSRPSPTAIPRQLAGGGRALVLWLLPIVLFAAAGCFGVLIAQPGEGRDEALRQLRRVIIEPLVVYALVRYWGRSRQVRRGLVAALVGGGAVAALIGALQLTGIDLAPVDGTFPCHSSTVEEAGGVRRVASVFCHPNNLGLYLGRIWPLGAALAWGTFRTPARRSDRARRALWIAASSLALFGLLISFSKGALLGALAALLLLIGFSGKRRALLIGGGALLAVLVIAIAAGPERLNPLGGSSDLRLSIWKSSLAMLRDHPRLGIGLGQFYYYYHPNGGQGYIRSEALAAQELHTSHPHNLPLDLLLQLGPLGLLAFTWLLLRLLRSIISGWRAGRDPFLLLGIYAATVAALVHGMVDQGYFYPDLANFFWLSLALAETAAASAVGDGLGLATGRTTQL